MPKTKAKTLDKLVGRRIRALRLLAGLTQGQLGDILGVTFQQVQKYETGANRVGIAMLWDIAVHLKVPITWFFEPAEQNPTAITAPLDIDWGTARLIRSYRAINDPLVRRQFVALAEALVASK